MKKAISRGLRVTPLVGALLTLTSHSWAQTPIKPQTALAVGRLFPMPLGLAGRAACSNTIRSELLRFIRKRVPLYKQSKSLSRHHRKWLDNADRTSRRLFQNGDELHMLNWGTFAGSWPTGTLTGTLSSPHFGADMDVTSSLSFQSAQGLLQSPPTAP